MFSLSKWYGDCIADNGDVFVGYSAELRWKALSLHYGSTLTNIDPSPAVQTTWRHEPPPKVDGEYCRWTSAGLHLSAIWRACQPAVADVIYRSPDGAVEWWCGWPAADARVRLKGDRAVEGCGYVEHVQLTIPPWKLPIRQLRWGHFVSSETYAVWIDWIGDFNKSVAFFDGTRDSNPQITDTRVSLSVAVIEMDRSLSLRQGSIGSTIFSALRHAAEWFPARTLAIAEQKWRSAAVMHRNGAPDLHGWAIHEYVEFP